MSPRPINLIDQRSLATVATGTPSHHERSPSDCGIIAYAAFKRCTYRQARHRLIRLGIYQPPHGCDTLRLCQVIRPPGRRIAWQKHCPTIADYLHTRPNWTGLIITTTSGDSPVFHAVPVVQGLAFNLTAHQTRHCRTLITVRVK